MVKNAFNQEIPEINEILKNDRVRNYIVNTLVSVLSTLGTENNNALVADMLKYTENYNDLERDYEKKAHEFLKEKGVTKERISKELSGRADLIYSQIKEYLRRGRVEDIGCGDGKVPEILSKKGFHTDLYDVIKYDNIDNLVKKGFEFTQYDEMGDIPNDKLYDNTLLLTVLHHSKVPLKTLENAIKKTKKGGRIIVIESVYGIDKDTKEPHYNEKSKKITEAFKELTHEEQRLANIFFDHFYNRIIHYSEESEGKVSVPYNFRKPKGKESWEKIFKAHRLKQIAIEYLGIDQQTVPEYHVLYVLEK